MCECEHLIPQVNNTCKPTLLCWVHRNIKSEALNLPLSRAQEI